MRKSIIEPARILKEELLLIPTMVTRFHKKEQAITDDWISWLSNLEQIFTKYNYSEAAEIAGYRASVLAAALKEEGKRVKKRKQMTIAALQSIQPVQEILSHTSRQLEDKIEMVRTLIKQILIPAKDAGMIQYNKKTDFTTYLETLLAQFKSHEQLAPGINNAIATIGKYDVIKIIAEEIEF